MNQRAGRLNLGVIGAQPRGLAMATALAGAGHYLVGLAALTSDNAEQAQRQLPDVQLLDVPQLLTEADLILLALDDLALQPAINEWAELGLWRAGQLVVHSAAEYGVGVLGPAARAGVIPLALHPAMYFTGTSLDVRRMREVQFGVTAPKAALPIAQALVIEMGGEPVIIDEADRPTYAEAIEVASDFSRLIIRQASGLLEQVGVENPNALIGPLVRSAVDQALQVPDAGEDWTAE